MYEFCHQVQRRTHCPGSDQSEPKEVLSPRRTHHPKPFKQVSTNMDRRIYIACLASYNAGSLVGAWIDMAEVLDTSDLKKRIQAAIKGEEWAIHDHEGWYGLLKGEWPDLEKLYETHVELQQHEDSCVDSNAIVAAVALSDDYTDITTIMNEYRGCYDKPGDYAYEFAEECGDLRNVPDFYKNHIDWESVEDELQIDGSIHVHTVNGTRYIFGQW
jgi:antirestriction protein